MREMTQEEFDKEKYSHNREYDHFYDNGKREINNLIWTLAPDYMTLREADNMALEIYQMLMDKWNKDDGD